MGEMTLLDNVNEAVIDATTRAAPVPLAAAAPRSAPGSARAHEPPSDRDGRSDVWEV